MHLLLHPRLCQAQQLTDMPLRNLEEPSTDQTVDQTEEEDVHMHLEQVHANRAGRNGSPHNAEDT